VGSRRITKTAFVAEKRGFRRSGLPLYCQHLLPPRCSSRARPRPRPGAVVRSGGPAAESSGSDASDGDREQENP